MGALRVPPPQATSLVEQWIIDALLHLDTCVDEAKTSSSAGFRMAAAERADMRASLDAWMIAGKAADGDLVRQWDDHIKFHKAGEAASLARKSVWEMQGELLGRVFKFGSQGVGLALIVFVLKQVGLW